MIQIKNAKELDGMRRANALSAAALKYGGEHIEAGMTTWELDKLIYDFIVKHGGIPNFKGLYGFPGTACISLNDTIIHGIPSHDIVIRPGDIVSIDTGAKVVHAAPNTSSHITTKSIARDGGISNFRSSVTVLPGAKNSRSAVSCESLMLDDRSRSDTIPEMDIRCDAVDVGHEAKIGRISEEAVFYLMSRGLSEEDARALIVGGFAEPIAKELPVEYAVEMNNLIHLEMKGSIG